MKKRIKDCTRYELLGTCSHNICSKCFLNKYNKKNARQCVYHTLLDLKYQEEEFKRIEKLYNKEKAKLESLKNQCREVLNLKIEVNKNA